MKKSPFAPKQFPKLPFIKGVSIWCGKHKKSAKRNDLLLVCFDKGTKAAGVWTAPKCALITSHYVANILRMDKQEDWWSMLAMRMLSQGKRGQRLAIRLLDNLHNP